MPFKTEIAPYLIVFRLENYDYAGATAVAAVLLVLSFLILGMVNYLEGWTSRFNK
jgi:sulfate/thiosulfate transport system permease protein